MKNTDFTSYQSPLSWRYGSPEMRSIFSEEHKYKLWRKVWVSMAEAQHKQGFVTSEELNDLQKNQENLDIDRILEIEKETHHDVVAAIREFAEKATIGGGKIHLGATSMDVVDNVDALRMLEGLVIIKNRIVTLAHSFSEKIEQTANTVCMGYTHLQPAEPTTLGYRFSFYGQDLLINYDFLSYVIKTLRGKGMKGAVGTSASYVELGLDVEAFEKDVMKSLGILPSDISTQVYTRTYDALIMSVIASIAASLGKFAADVRIMQSAPFGEWSEPFSSHQVGSSAMPFKKNPMISENICSLARYVATLPQVAFGNVAHSYLERTLDDSANKRIMIPEAFLALDEILLKTQKVVDGMSIHHNRIKKNLETYGIFAATEKIILESVKKGADRQEIHEIIRGLSLQAWESIQNNEANSLLQLMKRDVTILKYLNAEEIEKACLIDNHVGNAPSKAHTLAKKLSSISE